MVCCRTQQKKVRWIFCCRCFFLLFVTVVVMVQITEKGRCFVCMIGVIKVLTTRKVSIQTTFLLTNYTGGPLDMLHWTVGRNYYTTLLMSGPWFLNFWWIESISELKGQMDRKLYLQNSENSQFWLLLLNKSLQLALIWLFWREQSLLNVKNFQFQK